MSGYFLRVAQAHLTLKHPNAQGKSALLKRIDIQRFFDQEINVNSSLHMHHERISDTLHGQLDVIFARKVVGACVILCRRNYLEMTCGRIFPIAPSLFLISSSSLRLLPSCYSCWTRSSGVRLTEMLCCCGPVSIFEQCSS